MGRAGTRPPFQRKAFPILIVQYFQSCCCCIIRGLDSGRMWLPMGVSREERVEERGHHPIQYVLMYVVLSLSFSVFRSKGDIDLTPNNTEVEVDVARGRLYADKYLILDKTYKRVI